MVKVGKCPECGTPVGSDPGTDPYKHAISCLHLDPDLPDRMLEKANAKNHDLAARLKLLLDMAK